MSYAPSEASIDIERWQAARNAAEAEAARMRPSVLFRPSLTLDGNMYCALYGENLMEGCAGFGETAEAAMADFDKNWLAQKAPQMKRADPHVAPAHPQAADEQKQSDKARIERLIKDALIDNQCTSRDGTMVHEATRKVCEIAATIALTRGKP